MLPLKPKSYVKMKLTILSVVALCASCGWLDGKKSKTDETNHTHSVDETKPHPDETPAKPETPAATPLPTVTPEPAPHSMQESAKTDTDTKPSKTRPTEPAIPQKPKMLFFSGDYVFAGNQQMVKRYNPHAWESSIEYVEGNFINVHIEDTGEVHLKFRSQPDNSQTYPSLPFEWHFSPIVQSIDQQNEITYTSQAVQEYDDCTTPTKLSLYPEQRREYVFINIILNVEASGGPKCRNQNRMTSASFEVSSLPKFAVGRWQTSDGKYLTIRDDASVLLPKDNMIELPGIYRHALYGYQTRPMVHVKDLKWEFSVHWLEHQSDGVLIKCDKDFVNTFEFVDEGHTILKTRYNFCAINPRTGHENNDTEEILTLTKAPE